MQIHEDEIAERLGVKAVAHGTDLHFARGEYDPNSESGKWTIAHVVQQGLARPDAAAKENPQLARRIPRWKVRPSTHAAKAAMAGTPAQLSRGTTSLSSMGFDSWEHKMLGDLGSDGMSHAMGHGLTLSHGDIVMLMGSGWH